MNTNSTQKEILLITGTSFSSRQCYQKLDQSTQTNSSEKELLEEACWNGLLPEMLPELYDQNADEKLYLWQIRGAQSFIEIELGELPEEKENYLSIDPYLFLPVQFLS